VREDNQHDVLIIPAAFRKVHFFANRRGGETNRKVVLAGKQTVFKLIEQQEVFRSMRRTMDVETGLFPGVNFALLLYLSCPRSTLLV
jgi:hypothetical protein